MSSSFTTVQVDGRAYCAGLFWYPLDTGPNASTRQLATILQEQSAAFFTTRGKPALQVGLVGLDTPAQRGMPSIAASVADKLAQAGLRSFLVAFATDEPGQWCYVAQNQGLLQFDGDVAGDEETVRQRILSHQEALVDWELVVAPADWYVPGAVQRERADLVPRPRLVQSAASDVRLRPVPRQGAGVGSARSIVGMACVLLLCVEAGVGIWLNGNNADELEAARNAGMAEQSAFAAARPWVGKRSLAEWGPVCLDAIAREAWDLAGWTVRRAVCNPGARQLTVEWQRGTGARFDDLAVLQPQARLAPGAQEPAVASRVIALAVPLESLQLPIAPAELLSAADWQREASRWNEQWRERRPVFTPGPAGSGTGEIAWSLVDNGLPRDALRILALPGAVLSGVELNAKDGAAVWTVKAAHYVRD